MINSMKEHCDRVLLIENDPEISQLIVEQSLLPLGIEVDVFESGSSVVQELGNLTPDVIIADLNLPGLSCKDLMVALSSNGINAPIVIIANKGQESDILQTFRLGAVDFLFCPVRETEVIAVIENILKGQQLKRDLQISLQRSDQTQALMERQLAGFSEIFSFIKLACSTTDTGLLADKIVSLAMLLGEADSAWMLTMDASQAGFILRACQNVPEAMKAKLNCLYDDDLSSLATISKKVLAIHGEALKRYTGLEWIGAIIAVPVVQHGNVIALITAARYVPEPFTASQQAMLELLSEYAWMLLENASRFHRMEQSLVYLKQANTHANLESNLKYDLLRQASLELRNPLQDLIETVDTRLANTEIKLNRDQATALSDIQEEAEILMDISDSLLVSRQEETTRSMEQIDLNDVVRTVINRFRPIAQMGKITIIPELATTPCMIKVYPSQIMNVFEGLLSNALKYSPANGEVTIHIEQDEHNVTLTVNDLGDGIEDDLADRVFEVNSAIYGHSARRFGGIGISLATVKEVISAYKGQIWIDRLQGTGFTIAFSLPRG
jgi:signal transduction histidine kinase/FixJ family two-component response regulator